MSFLGYLLSAQEYLWEKYLIVTYARLSTVTTSWFAFTSINHQSRKKIALIY